MQEGGILNSKIAAAVARQGHGDLLLITDAGFAIPANMDYIDLSLTEGTPKVTEVVSILKPYYSVEKIWVSAEALAVNPTHVKNVSELLGADIPVENIPHPDFKEKSKSVKCIIRTGDFTAYGNVMLQSGAGNRWYEEIK